MGDEYIALYDCYFAGKMLKSGATITVAPGTKVTYPWLKKISEFEGEPKPKKPAKSKVKQEGEVDAKIKENLTE